MGATLGCAQCHDHKYDPYTTQDFYAFGAFFADLEEVGKYSARSRPPEVRVPTAEQRDLLAEKDALIGEVKKRLQKLRAVHLPAMSEWEAAAREQLAQGAKIENLPDDLAALLAMDTAERNEEQRAMLREFYLGQVEPVKLVMDELTKCQIDRKSIEDQIRTCVVSRSVEPRVVRILPRGNWMDDSGDVVGPAIPTFLGAVQSADGRPTRIDLARWLCAPQNPLTARTMVNRLWYLLFGRGIASSIDDLGAQGSFPSHPELLDWLAMEFVNSGWDIKHILRLIVTSDAYRRSSIPTTELRLRDPYNNWLARQGRFRLDAEMVRDSVLSIGGLLVERVGGESVKPYQPAGYYDQLNFPKRTYVADEGEKQYRRGIYSHWQRTFLHPMLKAFDAPSREECTAARARSSTPVQALTMLNDPTFVEAARMFAARILREGGYSEEDRLQWAYRQVFSRHPEHSIASELKGVYRSHREHYRQSPQLAHGLVSTGQAPVAADLQVAELAAWTSVARVLFNLHETIMRY
jgi:hypothetical protein